MYIVFKALFQRWHDVTLFAGFRTCCGGFGKVTTKNQHISAQNINILISVILAIGCFTASALDVASIL
jgi:hypothetical protein